MPHAKYEDGYFITDDGLKLHYRQYPANAAVKCNTPIICLPGLSRNIRDFNRLSQYLSTLTPQSYNVICLDYRGRGQSDWDNNKDNYNIIREAQDVVQLLAHLNIEKAAFIGTSRGGLILHILATMKADAIAAIIFNDIGPEIELGGLLDIKSYLKMDQSAPKTWYEAAQLQKSLHGADFPKLTDQDWLDMAHDIYIERAGQIMADFDPAIVDSIKVIDQNTKLPTLWEQFELLKRVPILTLRGANSKLFSEDTLQQMDQAHPKHISITVPDQGHPVLLQLDPARDQIVHFLAKTVD